MAGDFFGELALLHNQPRSTDVIAYTNLMLLALARDDFEDVTRSHPESRQRILMCADRRMRETASHAFADRSPFSCLAFAQGQQVRRRGSRQEGQQEEWAAALKRRPSAQPTRREGASWERG